MYIILLGAPGAGKGTQAAIVARELRLEHVATGDLFRQTAEKGTELGLELKSYMGKGLLVPDEITMKMLLERVLAADAASGVVFDGFPRNLTQARALDGALSRQGKAIDRVVYIKVSSDELLKRLSERWICRRCQAPYHAVSSPPRVQGRCDRCGGELFQRSDDTPETVKKRLAVYFAETASLIDYYNEQGKLVEVNGEGTVDEVGHRIIGVLAG